MLMNATDLDRQLQDLIQQAPQDGKMPQVMQAIAPILRAFAEKLQRPEFYILQNTDQRWVVTVQSTPDRTAERRVVYAFANLEDARLGSQLSGSQDLGVISVPVPVTHILFQLMSMKPIHSCIFFPTPGDVQRGIEIKRVDVEAAIQLQLQQRTQPIVPPDLA